MTSRNISFPYPHARRRNDNPLQFNRSVLRDKSEQDGKAGDFPRLIFSYDIAGVRVREAAEVFVLRPAADQSVVLRATLQGADKGHIIPVRFAQQHFRHL